MTGIVQARRSRQTGHVVSVHRPGELESDPSAKWMIVCEAHEECVGHPTRALAIAWAADPQGWCSKCLCERERKRKEPTP